MFIDFILFINSELTNFAGEKLVLHEFYKPHIIKATLQSLIHFYSDYKKASWDVERDN